MGGVSDTTYFPKTRETKLTNLQQQKRNKMLYTLKKFKRDSWSGLTRMNDTFVQIGLETNQDGDYATGMTGKQAREMEVLLFKPVGYLDNNAESEFWRDYKISLPITGIKLDDEVPRQKLQLYILKAMKKVANGADDLKKKSKAEYMLTSTVLVELEEDDRLSVKEVAYGHLSESSLTKQKQLYAVLQASLKKGAKIVDTDSMTDKAIKNGLRIAIEANATSFNLIAEDLKLTLKFTILNLVSKGIIGTQNGGYFEGVVQLAHDLDSMVEYMESPQYQQKVIQFNLQLSGKVAKTKPVAMKLAKGEKIPVRLVDEDIEENEVTD